MDGLSSENGRITLPSGTWGVVPEQNRQQRGHDFYPSFAELAKIPPLGQTDGLPAAEVKVHLHYFTANCDWYITELDPTDGTAFGWARVNYPEGEWGYVNLNELEELYIPARRVALGIALPVIVERDLYFEPALATDCIRDGNGRKIDF